MAENKQRGQGLDLSHLPKDQHAYTTSTRAARATGPAPASQVTTPFCGGHEA